MKKAVLFFIMCSFVVVGGAQDADIIKTADTLVKKSESILPDSAANVSANNGPTDTAKVAPPEYVVYLDSGIASWYGPHWEGRLTASGEYFSPDSMTAAHKWLPFGTIVKVTNLKNDSVIYVRITDRLPKSSTRSIDLTPVAAKRLGFYSDGLQKVEMESVDLTPVRRKTKSVGAAQAPRG